VKKVDILGEKYKVTSRLPSKYRKEVDPSLYSGLCFREDNLIWISPKLEGKNYIKTLIHEMGHGLLMSNAITYTGTISPELEEILVETNSSMVFTFMQQMIKDYLKEEDDTVLRSRLSKFTKL